MSRPALEVADIFRDHGPAWRRANAGHVSLEQLKVMSAIENCRTAALGGHVARCEDCAYTTIAYNSCLMGKFRNGELATRCIGGSVDFGDLTLHYGPPLGPAISRPEVKGRFRRAGGPVASMASSFSSGSTAQADFGGRRFPASDPRRHAAKTLCRPGARSPVGRSRRATVVMESKRQADRRRSI